MKNLKIAVDEDRNDVTISLVDETGNGIILVRGKLGGCDFLSKAEQASRIKALRKLMLDKSPESLDGTD